MTEGYCEGCKRLALLAPLHGPDKGGPLRCFVCAGAWHAEHGRKRKTGRVVIRAMKAFLDAGGSWKDLLKLTHTARFGDDTLRCGIEAFLDPLGYMAETAKTADETILLTSELLADALRLVHPDVHPPERSELANRVTQQLLALQPFVFPAKKPEPVEPHEPERNASSKWSPRNLKEPSRPTRYPCAECASTVPHFYCSPCRAEFERRCREERERANAKQRKWYAQRKAWRALAQPSTPCVACGKATKGKRKDARYCSAACRQRAHRKAASRSAPQATRPPHGKSPQPLVFAAPHFCPRAVPRRTPHTPRGGGVRQPERPTCRTLPRRTFASAATRAGGRCADGRRHLAQARACSAQRDGRTLSASP